MADQHQRITLLGELDRLNVNFGDQRTGGIDDFELAILRAAPDSRGNTMSAVDDTHAGGDLVDVVDEDCTLLRQFVHNKAIVDDLLADINGRPEGFKGNLHHINGADNACTEAAGLEQKNALLDPRRVRFLERGGGVKRGSS